LPLGFHSKLGPFPLPAGAERQGTAFPKLDQNGPFTTIVVSFDRTLEVPLFAFYSPGSPTLRRPVPPPLCPSGPQLLRPLVPPSLVPLSLPRTFPENYHLPALTSGRGRCASDRPYRAPIGHSRVLPRSVQNLSIGNTGLLVTMRDRASISNPSNHFQAPSFFIFSSPACGLIHATCHTIYRVKKGPASSLFAGPFCLDSRLPTVVCRLPAVFVIRPPSTSSLSNPLILKE
jgi:hypothetical protein